jgi:hypothetical protein
MMHFTAPIYNSNYSSNYGERSPLSALQDQTTSQPRHLQGLVREPQVEGVQGLWQEHLHPQLQRGLCLPKQVPFKGNRLYLYGGHQILSGALKDFYRIGLDDEQSTYNWEEVVAQGGVHPGRRSKHALLPARDKIYLIGGLKGNNEASN